MAGRHQPTMGADSPEALMDVLQSDALQGDADDYERPFRVLVEEELGSRFWVTVRAIGPKGARETAVETAHQRGYYDATALAVEEVVG